MRENDYRYLFPYEKIRQGSKIVIYGCGDLGQDYLYQMKLTNYCDVVAMADKNYKKYPNMVVPVISPQSIKECIFDYVVVALRMQTGYQEALRVLHEQGISHGQVVCIFERTETPMIFDKHVQDDFNIEKLSFHSSFKSIAILCTGGYGDLVIQKRVVLEVLKLAPDCCIDFYNIKSIDFLKRLYSGVGNVNQIINDLGFRYRKVRGSYMLALTIEACHFIKVDVWDAGAAGRVFPDEFRKRISKLKEETDKDNIRLNTPAHLTMYRRLYKGLNAYSGFNYDGAFNIQDKKVSILVDPSFEDKFQSLSLKHYVTVNCGNGDSLDSRGIAKSWKKESFEQVLKAIKKKYGNIQIVQLGIKEAVHLKGADKYILGEDFGLVFHILKNSLFHLDIEGGLVHVASQLGTKCIVLFGPTVEAYYAYGQNINLHAGNCHNCWGLYSNVNRCARGMEFPECMSSITPDMVIDAVDDCMREIRGKG